VFRFKSFQLDKFIYPYKDKSLRGAVGVDLCWCKWTRNQSCFFFSYFCFENNYI